MGQFEVTFNCQVIGSENIVPPEINFAILYLERFNS